MHYRKLSVLLMLALLMVSVAPLAAQDATEEPTDTENVYQPFGDIPVDEAGFPPLSEPFPLFEVIEETDETITVQHLRGETTFPRNPERIVVSLGTEEILLSLGIVPIATAARTDVSPVVREVAPDLIFLPVVDSGPNLEQLLELEPDLIIGWSFLGGNNPDDYDLISEIAPTVIFNIAPQFNFQDSTRQIATLFDREEEAEEAISDYNERVESIRNQVAPIFGDDTVSPILFFGDTPSLFSPRFELEGRVYVLESVSWLYHELRLTPSAEQAALLMTDEGLVFRAELSGELLPEIQAEHLVVFPAGYSGANEPGEGYFEFTDGNLVWEALPAVQSGDIYLITGVNRASGYYTYLDTMERFAEAVLAQTEASD